MRPLLRLSLYGFLLFEKLIEKLRTILRFKAYLLIIGEGDRFIELIIHREVYEPLGGCGLGAGWEHILNGGERSVLYCWWTGRVPRVN